MKNRIQNKALVALLSIAFSPTLVMAAGKPKTHPAWTWIMNNILIVITVMVLVGVFAALWNLMTSIMIDKSREYLRAQGIEPLAPSSISSETFISRWYTKAWNLVPIEQEADIQLDHNYDGIRELDNSLPPWWLYGFYLSIIVAIGYMYVYHFSDIGLSQQQEYEVAMEKAEYQKMIYASMQGNQIDEKNLVMLTDDKSIATGASIFLANCAACHGQEGQGGVGPNLTDKFWIHGGSIGSIYKTIKNGVPEKGMIAWKAQLKPTTIHKIASYIQTLKGTNPPNPKAPEGSEYEEEAIGSIGAVIIK